MSLFKTWKRNRSERLFTRGMDFLESGDLDAAARVGQKLIDLHYSGGFELKARALWEKGDAFEAIALLRRGTARVPQVPALWSYLGQFLSDSGAYDEATDAFQRSAFGGEGWQDTARYNVALVRIKQGRQEEALEELRRVGNSGPPRAVIHEAEVGILLELDNTRHPQVHPRESCDARTNPRSSGPRLRIAGGKRPRPQRSSRRHPHGQNSL